MLRPDVLQLCLKLSRLLEMRGLLGLIFLRQFLYRGFQLVDVDLKLIVLKL